MCSPQSLTKVYSIKTVKFCCSILLVLLKNETSSLHQEITWNKEIYSQTSHQIVKAQASQVPECCWLFLSLLTGPSTLKTIDFYQFLSILLHVPL